MQGEEGFVVAKLLYSAGVLVSYFFGSIPFGFMVAKMKGVDIRTVGSGNVGATNVGRTFGFKYFVLVFGLDLLKGYAAIAVFAVLAWNSTGWLGVPQCAS